MSVFFADLWADLRAKKLWPVALVLAAAIVVVPLVLLEPAAEKPAAAPGGGGAGASASAKSALVTAVDAPEAGSRLGVFRPHDPFASQADRPGDEAGGPGAGGSGSSVDPGAGSGANLGPESLGAAPSGGSTGASGGSGGSGGTGGETTFYTYTADVRFGRSGSERRYDNVERLDLLPSDDNPMLVFLGASPDGDEAVFLVDSSLSQSGEGVCKPSTDVCSFVYLRTREDQNDHNFADVAGRNYHLELLRIERKKVSDEDVQSSRARRSSRRGGVKGSRATARRSARAFLFRPFLLDGSARRR
jgi:hypothetical protein